MSEKSRKRNKRLLMLAALAGGAALMGRRKKGNVERTAAMEDANINTTAPILGTDHIKKAIIPKSKPVDDSWLDTPRGPHGAGAKGDYWRRKKALALTAGNKVPPSMRGGAIHAQGYTPRPVRDVFTGSGVDNMYQSARKGGRIGAKKGGSVTGIAKRGFGRALMKGKK